MEMPEAQIEILEVHECPEANFKHYSKCPITTCQYNTDVTETGCLARDRYETSSKAMSDAEMYLYKMPEALNVRQVGTKRKNAVKKVKNLICLSFFIFYVADKYKPEDGYVYREGKNIKVDELVSDYPFNIPDLKFEPWQLKFLLSEDVYQSYIKDEVSKLSNDVSLRNMLNLTPRKLQKLQKMVLS